MKEKLYRYNIDFGRMGEVFGTFVATPEALSDMCGHEIYFGEILGKHSDIDCTFEEDDFEVLTDDKDFIAKLRQLGMDSTGYNPFDFYEDAKEDSRYEDDD